jgi:hypothetical protein
MARRPNPSGAIEDARAAAFAILRQYNNNADQAMHQVVTLALRRRETLNAAILDWLRLLQAYAQPPAEAAEEAITPMPSVTAPTAPAREAARRTPGQRQAALEAKIGAADAIFFSRRIDGTFIGQLKWRLVSLYRRVYAEKARQWFKLGSSDAENAILLDLMLQHAEVADGDTQVMNVLRATVLSGLIDQAKDAARHASLHQIEALAQKTDRLDDIGPASAQPKTESSDAVRAEN